MGFFDKINEGLHRSRTRLKEQMNILLDRGPDVDDDFWDDLEETLILADIGAAAADSIIEELRDQAKRKALPDAYAVFVCLPIRWRRRLPKRKLISSRRIHLWFCSSASMGQVKLPLLVSLLLLIMRREERFSWVVQTRSALLLLNSLRCGPSALTLLLFLANGAATLQAYATKPSNEPKKTVPIWCSLTLRDVFIHPMTLCVSCKRLSTWSQTLKRSCIHSACHRCHNWAEWPSAGSEVQRCA